MRLMEPGRIGTMTVKNRVVMAAMGIRGLVEPDGDWGERARAYYAARAAGGTGLITTEMVFVSRALEHASRGAFDPASDKHLASLRLLADALHAHGCKLSVQLTAGFGRVVPAFLFPEWWKTHPLPADMMPVSASANPNHYLPANPRFNTRALTTEEAAAHAQVFGYAAARAREGGADCVELHGHEGYLLDQFMTGLWNRRADRYGGSREKRLTFAREAIAAIQRDAGADFPIIYRFGLTHYLDGGREPEEGLWIARELEQMGVAALHVDAGCYETHWWPHPPQYQSPGCMVNLAAQVRQVTSVPVIAVGRLQYPEVAEQVLAEGKADFIALGRGLLADPAWADKVQTGRVAGIIPCIGCHEGCLQQMINGKPTSCALNPTTGHELDWPLLQMKENGALLVVGGGPAGIEAARAGVKRGLEVTLWEASDRLGGNLWPAARPDFKHDIARYLDYLNHLQQQLPVRIVLNKRATADDIRRFGADYVVLATGAAMEEPPFDSDASVAVLTAIEVLNGTTPQGEHILVMGGGLIGCEVALYLARQGKQVTLSTRRDAGKLGGDIADRNNRRMLLQMIADAGITVLAGTVPIRLEDGTVVASRDGIETTIGVDSVVFAGRLVPQDQMARSLGEGAGNVFTVGDCVKPDTIMHAVWASFTAVRELQG